LSINKIIGRKFATTEIASKGLYSNSSTKKQTFKKVFITFGAKFK